MMSLLCSFGTVMGQDYAVTSAENSIHQSLQSIAQPDTNHFEVGKLVNGFSLVYQGEKYYLQDRLGKRINQKGYSQLRDMYNKRAAFFDGKNWGYLNEKGIEIIPAIYSSVFDFQKLTAAVLRDDKWAMIDLNGKLVHYLNTETFLKQFNKDLTSKPGPSQNRKSITALPDTESVTAACPSNINFENGDFTNWTCYTGLTTCTGTVNNTTLALSAPTAGRHTIIPRVLPSAIDQWGLFETNPPDGSNFCVRLGQSGTTSRQAEKIRYVINVPVGTNSYSITYQYAVVFQDPGHSPSCRQPRFIATLIDPVTGVNIGCATHQYVATSTLPGFINSPLSNSVKYKSWSSVFISLTRYAGQQLFLEFTTADCTEGGHWGYAYVDVKNSSCDLTAEVTYECDPPHITTIAAPPGFDNYIWWDQNFTTQLGTSNTLVLNPGPPVGTIFNVEVFPFAGFGCRDTLPVLINPILPTAIFQAPQAQCLNNNNFTFTSNSTVTFGSIASQTWHFGDGTTATGSPVSHSYALPGNYTVKLVVGTQNGCRDSVEHVVRVENPVVNFTVPNGQCLAGNSFSFTSTSSVLNGTVQSLDWDFGDGSTATGTTVSHTYTNTGVFPVKLLVTSSLGCKDSLIQNIIIFAQPIPSYTIPQGQCLSGNNFSFTSSASVSNGSISNLLWDFGDGSTGIGTPVSHSYAASGTYNVKLIAATDRGCSDSITQSITVHPQPSAAFNAPSAQCLSGNSFSFSSSSPGNITGFNWNFGDGGSGTGSPALHSYTTAGNFTVKMVITDNNGCKDSLTGAIRVYPQPNLVFAVPQGQCLNGNNFNFISNSNVTGGTITSHNWDFGDGGNGSGNSVNHNYAAAGTYNVKLVVTTNNGCKDSVTQVAAVNPHPVGALAIPASTSICDGGTQRLTATGGSVYQWYHNTVAIPNANAAIYNAAISGTYTVSINSAQGCPGVVPGSVSLTISKKPNADFIFPLQCQGTPVLFNNRSDSSNAGPMAWTWFFGDGNQSTNTSPTHFYSSGGNFAVTLRAAPFNCPNLASTMTKMVAVEAIKPGIRYPTINTLTGRNTDLLARNFGSQYLWSPANALTDNKVFNPVFNSNSQIEYIIRITTALGCVTNDTQLVRVFKLPDVQVPTAFSPNGDGHNDYLDLFLISIKELKYFRVYNRWGQLVFETRDASQRWDGRFKSSDQPLETYIWITEAVGTDNVPIVRRGQTILIR